MGSGAPPAMRCGSQCSERRRTTSAASGSGQRTPSRSSARPAAGSGAEHCRDDQPATPSPRHAPSSTSPSDAAASRAGRLRVPAHATPATCATATSRATPATTLRPDRRGQAAAFAQRRQRPGHQQATSAQPGDPHRASRRRRAPIGDVRVPRAATASANAGCARQPAGRGRHAAERAEQQATQARPAIGDRAAPGGTQASVPQSSVIGSSIVGGNWRWNPRAAGSRALRPIGQRELALGVSATSRTNCSSPSCVPAVAAGARSRRARRDRRRCRPAGGSCRRRLHRGLGGGRSDCVGNIVVTEPAISRGEDASAEVAAQ